MSHSQRRVERYTVAHWSAVGLLLFFALSRLHALGVFPTFLDEGIVINWAQGTATGRPLYFAYAGRVLASWWMALFGPFDSPLWIGRASQILISLIGAAATYCLGSRVHSRRAGLYALILLDLCPFMFFFDRMIIPDAIGAALSTAVLAVVVSPRMRWQDGILTGLCLLLAILSRATLVILLPVPLLAYLLLKRRGASLRWLLVTYATLFVLLVPILIVFRMHGQDYFTGFAVKGGGTIAGLPEQLIANGKLLIDAFSAYLGPVGIAMLFILAPYGAIQNRRDLWLAISPLALLLSIAAFGKSVSIRYYVPALPALIVLTAVGLVAVSDRISKSYPRLRTAPAAVVIGLWAVSFALPFQWLAFHSPERLPLPPNDINEYIANESSGYALPNVALKLKEMGGQADEPLHVIGWQANCVGLATYFTRSDPVRLECPTIHWTGDSAPVFAADLNSRLVNGEPVLVVSEDLSYLPDSALPAGRKLVAAFKRPISGSTIRLWAFDHP